jgi:hypothetical protein
MSEPQERSKSELEDSSEMSAESDAMDCPLFMEGLPKNFSENAALSALASLLDEPEQQQGQQDDKTQQQKERSDDTTFETEQIARKFEKEDSRLQIEFSSSSGGGKARRAKFHQHTQHATAPYHYKNEVGNHSKKQAKNSKPPPSIGESTLYLKLWKL